MTRALFLTAAIAVREASECITDAGRLCDVLQETEDAQSLREVAERLAPIAAKLRARSHEPARSEGSGTDDGSGISSGGDAPGSGAAPPRGSGGDGV